MNGIQKRILKTQRGEQLFSRMCYHLTDVDCTAGSLFGKAASFTITKTVPVPSYRLILVFMLLSMLHKTVK